ncbi:MAG: recombinase family protein [Candidatus Komeilibacteria bacterium]|nr:recombinase family protein [Candidatus Komeilibacteria bacterium]
MRYILYCRKSTDTEDKQVLSLESQEAELRGIAGRHGLEIVATLQESRSAKAEGRPVFNAMVDMIQRKKADSIICWKLDRLARNFIDGGRVIDLLQKGVIKEIRTHEATHLPSDNVLLLAVQLGMANQYIRDLSENVKRGNRTKMERGEWPSYAPFGYQNDRVNKTILLDERTAPYIRRIYELYSTGAYTLEQIRKITYGEGLRSKSGRSVGKNQIHRFLQSKFYLGLMERGGKIYQGKHTSLVSRELYDRVQDVLHGRLHPRPKKYFYSARGFLTCGNCGCMLTADTKKGHQYYYCTNGKGYCQEHRSYLRASDVDVLLSRLFLELHFDEELIEISGEAYRQSRLSGSSFVNHALQTLQNELQGLSERESMLTDAYTAKTLRKELYEAKMQELANRRVELYSQIENASREDRPKATFEQVREVFLDGNKAAKRYVEVGDVEKRNMLEKLLSNASIRNKNIAQYTFKSPYQILANTPKTADFQTLSAQ